MKLYRLQRRQYLPLSLATAWQFFCNPSNLAVITPPWLNFVITSELPEKIYPGLIITYKVSPILGVPIQWVTEITHMNEPNFFVDEQRFGPYRLWHHQHLFKETEHGVEMEDIVHYALPYGPLGTIVHELMVKQKLQEIFDYRFKLLTDKFN